MKTYTTTRALLKAVIAEECPIYPVSDIYKIMVDDQSIEEVTLAEIAERFQHEEEELDYWVGGYINICETEEDLKQIQSRSLEFA